MGDLSKNFSRWEFTCSCGCGLDNISTQLIDPLQRLRDHLGLVVTITSGIRCPKHNRKVKGAKGSFHLAGLACDFIAAEKPLIEIYRAAIMIRDFQLGGIGLYPPWYEDGRKRDGFLHVDVGKQRRWGRVKGNYCSIQTAVENLKRQEVVNDQSGTFGNGTNKPGIGSNGDRSGDGRQGSD